MTIAATTAVIIMMMMMMMLIMMMIIIVILLLIIARRITKIITNLRAIVITIVMKIMIALIIMIHNGLRSRLHFTALRNSLIFPLFCSCISIFKRKKIVKHV